MVRPQYGSSSRRLKAVKIASPKLEKTPTLNNEGVIRLVDAGFSEGTIIKRIEESPVEFDLSPGKVEELYKQRVTEPIIAAMRTAMGLNKTSIFPQRRKGAKTQSTSASQAAGFLCAPLPRNHLNTRIT